MLELLFAGAVTIVLPARAWSRHRHGTPPASWERYVAETLILTIALAGLLWRRGVTLESLGLEPRSALRFAADLALCLALIVGVDAWSVWRITRRSRHVAELPAPEGMVAQALVGPRARASFVAATIVGAVWEELCFRATVFVLMPDTAIGRLLGIASGALLFGAQHLRHGPSGMAYSSFFGVMFALLFLITHNLMAVVIAHAAGNILTALQWAPRIERARQEALRRQAPMFLG